MGSINHAFAISEKTRKRMGHMWCSIDFEVDRTSMSNYRKEGKGVNAGHLIVGGSRIPLRKSQIAYLIGYLQAEVQLGKIRKYGRDYEYPVSIAGNNFKLNTSVINRIVETLEDTLRTIDSGYKVGTYL